MLCIIDRCNDPYWNLAAEEYLLKSIKEPVFRLWRNDNAIIVGHYQNTIAEIDVNYVKEHGIKVVRRLTGGGAVFHDLGNLNFTFIEQKHPGEDATAMFRRFTAPIIGALNAIGVKAYLEGRNDLLIDGRKFSGNAVCIHKDRILQHGTLLFSASMNNLSAALRSRPEKFIGKAVQSNRNRVTNISEHLPQAVNGRECPVRDILSFMDYLKEYMARTSGDMVMYGYTPEDIRAIDELAATRYSQESWNFGASPAYGFSKSAKLPGGIVEIRMNVEKGRISDLSVMGDYFFTLPTEDFIERMVGTEHTLDKVEKALESIDAEVKAAGNPLGIQGYFSNIGIQDLRDMFFE